MDLITLVLARKYVQDTLSGSGALKGEPGKSAYEIAQENGFSGTEAEWILSLQGQAGTTPHIGNNGHWFIGNIDTGVSATPDNTVDYNDLENKPTINGESFSGDFEIKTISAEMLNQIFEEVEA